AAVDEVWRRNRAAHRCLCGLARAGVTAKEKELFAYDTTADGTSVFIESFAAACGKELVASIVERLFIDLIERTMVLVGPALCDQIGVAGKSVSYRRRGNALGEADFGNRVIVDGVDDVRPLIEIE